MKFSSHFPSSSPPKNFRSAKTPLKPGSIRYCINNWFQIAWSRAPKMLRGGPEGDRNGTALTAQPPSGTSLSPSLFNLPVSPLEPPPALPISLPFVPTLEAINGRLFHDTQLCHFWSRRFVSSDDDNIGEQGTPKGGSLLPALFFLSLSDLPKAKATAHSVFARPLMKVTGGQLSWLFFFSLPSANPSPSRHRNKSD